MYSNMMTKNVFVTSILFPVPLVPAPTSWNNIPISFEKAFSMFLEISDALSVDYNSFAFQFLGLRLIVQHA